MSSGSIQVRILYSPKVGDRARETMGLWGIDDLKYRLATSRNFDRKERPVLNFQFWDTISIIHFQIILLLGYSDMRNRLESFLRFVRLWFCGLGAN